MAGNALAGHCVKSPRPDQFDHIIRIIQLGRSWPKFEMRGLFESAVHVLFCACRDDWLAAAAHVRGEPGARVKKDTHVRGVRGEPFEYDNINREIIDNRPRVTKAK